MEPSQPERIISELKKERKEGRKKDRQKERKKEGRKERKKERKGTALHRNNCMHLPAPSHLKLRTRCEDAGLQKALAGGHAAWLLAPLVDATNCNTKLGVRVQS